jgi:ribosomal protein L7/L12
MLSLALRKAQAAGESIAPVLHEFYPQVSVIRLITGVREAFDVGLTAAKTLVDTACDGKSDEQVKVMLNAVVKAQREASPGVGLDEWRVMMDALDQWLSRAGATP